MYTSFTILCTHNLFIAHDIIMCSPPASSAAFFLQLCF